MKTTSITSLTMAAAAAAITIVAAKPGFVKLVPNGDSVKGVSGLGHVDPAGGGALNPFGDAFLAAGTKWTPELCQADSDGDGQTNGQELGDPCCIWKVGDPVLFSDASHPGDAKSKTDPKNYEGYKCDGSPGSGSKATAASTASPSPTIGGTAAPSAGPTTNSSATPAPKSSVPAASSSGGPVATISGLTSAIVIGMAALAQW